MFPCKQPLGSRIWLASLLFAPFFLANEAFSGDTPAPLATRLRRPVAIAATAERLVIANRESGTVSIVRAASQSTVAEVPIGQRLSDLARVADTGWLLATDESQHQVILLSEHEDQIEVVDRFSISKWPVSIVVSPDGKFASIASLWSRQITLLALEIQSNGPGKRLTVQEEIVFDVSIAPRQQCFSQDGQWLIVADSFSGRLIVISTRQRAPVALRTIEGHNIRGLAATHDGREIAVTHQLLNQQMATVRERINWGGVLSNILKSISIDEFLPTTETTLEPSSLAEKSISHWSLWPLGQPGYAGGDPGEVAVTQDGAAVIALGGVDEVVIRRSIYEPIVRRPVGRRPTAVALSPDHNTAYVANTLDDSISVVDIGSRQVTSTISLGPAPNLSLAERGEQLFYDAKLSLDGWYSCHSCHTDGHTCGLLNDNLGDDSFGAPKRILSLLGAHQTGPWAWSGKSADFHQQIHTSIETTMRGDGLATSDDRIDALAAYLATLGPPPSLPDARGRTDAAAVRRGRLVFESTGCVQCHQPPTYTTPDVYEVGLSDELGRSTFNPPSLRGLSQRSAYFHDNRAGSLSEVFVKFDHQGTADLPAEDLADLVAFLRSR